MEEKIRTDDSCTNWTALMFLRTMWEFSRIFLQDAAAMLVAHPDREEHIVYSNIPVLRTPEFKVSGRCVLFLLFAATATNESFFLLFFF